VLQALGKGSGSADRASLPEREYRC
jgi:hypothetical protein